MANNTRRDLSDLPDALLICILSHLPTDEAVRTGVLSRRWRRLHDAVPVVDLVDPNVGERYGLDTPPICFDQKVTCALLSRPARAPIRAFRLDAYHPMRALLGQWIVIALTSGAEELDVKLRLEESSRLRGCPFAPYEEASADFAEGDRRRYARTYPHMFRSATLRRLSLSRWTLDLPRHVSVESLETLALHRIMGSGEALRRLVSSCPRLVSLTLDECPGVTELTVPSACLQSFAMVCCHNATRVVLESRCLRSLRYKGGLPCDRSFLSVANHAALAAVTIDICEDVEARTPRDVAPVTELVAMCSNLTFLHLALRPAMAYYSSLFASVLRCLTHLRHLELKGHLRSDHTVAAVAVLLQNAPNLEALSLFPLLPDPPKKRRFYYSEDSESEEGYPDNQDGGSDGYSDSEDGDSDDEDGDSDSEVTSNQNVDFSGQVQVPQGLLTAPVWCLKHRLKRISLVRYRGQPFERTLAKFLLSKAEALDELSVSLARGLAKHRIAQIARELVSWRFDRRTRVTFV